MIRKQNLIYNFSVEGETEKLYLTKLQHLINSDDSSVYKVKFDCTINKNPLSRIKMLNNSSVSIVQVFDFESNEVEHEALFLRTLDDMKKA